MRRLVGAMVIGALCGGLVTWGAMFFYAKGIMAVSEQLVICRESLGEADIEVGACQHALLDCQDSARAVSYER